MLSRLHRGTRADDGKEQSVYTKDPECGMGCNGSFVGRKRSGGWVMSLKKMGKCRSVIRRKRSGDGGEWSVCMVRSEKSL